MKLATGAGLVLALGTWVTLASAAVPRTVPVVAGIVAIKGDEQVRFLDDPRWRAAELAQDLGAGDLLQTGRYGGLAVLFRDRTQIRVRANSSLLIKDVRPSSGPGETVIRLERGGTWSRATSVPRGLKIETPAATAAIRGTDWSLQVEDDGRTTLTVMFGEVDFFNDQGAVTVTPGEVATAEVGQAPRKTFLVGLRDRPQWELVFTPDWIRFLPVTGLTVSVLKVRARDLTRGAPDADARLELAEISYELGRLPEARERVEAVRRAGGTPEARIALLEGLLALADYRFGEAARLFERAASDLEGRRRLIAELGRYAIDFAERRYDDAERRLDALAVAWDAYAEITLFRIQLASFRGEQRQAIALAHAGRARFPDDVRFLLWLAELSLLLDERADMRAAIDAALALDPEQHLAWSLRGLYHQYVDANLAAAEQAYRRALEIVPDYAPPWNGLALVFTARGDFKSATEAIRHALRLAPRDTLYMVTYANILLRLDRETEAERWIQRALASDPADAAALSAAGVLALRRGQMERALDSTLGATTVNPGQTDAMKGLGIAYYQAGQFDPARRTIENATRLDPNDPVAPLIGSIMAQDQADAGTAIDLARVALERFERLPTLAAEGLATSRSGVMNLGSAYANLGLTGWGDYYAQLSFDPYWAGSHFHLSTYEASGLARRGEAVQGLLLDPLAISSRARYFDFIRRPFTDVSIGASVGTLDGSFTHGQSATVQGFARLGVPVAYNVSVRRDHDDGFRNNSASTTEEIVIGFGTRVDLAHEVQVTLSGGRARLGVPGSRDEPGADDRIANDAVRGALGYHYRAGPSNHVIARLAGGYTHDRYRNDDALGFGLSDRAASLLHAFGRTSSVDLYRAGICDATASPFFVVLPGRPFLLAGSFLCPAFALPFVGNELPSAIDVNPIHAVHQEAVFGLVQARHLLDVAGLQVTYGGEWMPSWTERITERVRIRPDAIAAIAVPPAPFPILGFPFGPAILSRTSEYDEGMSGVGYIDLATPPHRALALEAGLFVRYFDDGAGTIDTQLDPRAGVAWRVAPRQWLRVATQRNLSLPIEATLAPIGTVGLTPRDDFAPSGSSTTSWQARWDAEWHRRVFTLVTAEERRIHRFVVPIPATLASFATEHARIRGLTAALETWLGDGWGAFARHRWNWTEDISTGVDRGRALPLIPERTLDLGLTWIHPAQVRAALVVSYLGDRPGDSANTRTLGGYWTANTSVNWQPERKRWSITVAAQSVLDQPYELALRVPAPSYGMTFSAEYRF